MPRLRLTSEGPVAGGHGGEVFCLAYEPQGRFLLSGGWDGCLRLWDVHTGAQVTALSASPKAISACAISPDGKQWLSGALDGFLAVWDAATHQRVGGQMLHTRPISTVVFSPGGGEMMTASWDGTVGVWDRVRERDGRVLVGHDDIVAGCRFTPDGAHLFSWSHDGSACVWDLRRGQAVARLGGQGDRLTAGAVAPDGLWAATGARDGALTLWDLRAERPAHTACLGAEVCGCFFLPDGESLVAIDRAGRVVLHGVPDLQERQEVVTRRAVQCADLAPDGQGLALGCEDGRICLLAVDGLESAPLLVTPTQTAPPRPSRWQRLLGGRRPHPAYACTCPSCHHSFPMPDGSLGQPASCPSCRRSLRLGHVARLA